MVLTYFFVYFGTISRYCFEQRLGIFPSETIFFKNVWSASSTNTPMRNEHPCFREELTEVIELARSGDAEAMGILLRSSRAALRERAAGELPREVQTRLDPSDVIQDVLLEASHDFESFRGQSSGEWRMWLRRILANNVVEALRRHVYAEKRSIRNERRQGGDSWRDCEVAAEDLSPSQCAAQTELAEWLNVFQADLDPDSQTILKLRYWEDCSLNEIAARMNLSKSGAARLLRKALLALRQQVTKEIGRDDSL